MSNEQTQPIARPLAAQARRAGIPRRTLADWAARGLVTSIRVPGPTAARDYILIRDRDLEDFLKRHEVPARTQPTRRTR